MGKGRDSTPGAPAHGRPSSGSGLGTDGALPNKVVSAATVEAAMFSAASLTLFLIQLCATQLHGFSEVIYQDRRTETDAVAVKSL